MEGRQLPIQAQEALEQVAKQGGSGEGALQLNFITNAPVALVYGPNIISMCTWVPFTALVAARVHMRASLTEILVTAVTSCLRV